MEDALNPAREIMDEVVLVYNPSMLVRYTKIDIITVDKTLNRSSPMTLLHAPDPLVFLNDLVVDENMELFRCINNLDVYREASFSSISQETLFKFLKDSHAVEFGRQAWPKEQEGLIKCIVDSCISQRSNPVKRARLSHLTLGAAFGLNILPRLADVKALESLSVKVYQEEKMANSMGFSFHGSLPIHRVSRIRYEDDFPKQDQLNICHMTTWSKVYTLAKQAAEDAEQLKLLVQANESKGYFQPLELWNVLKPFGVKEEDFVAFSGPQVRRAFLEQSLTF